MNESKVTIETADGPMDAFLVLPDGNSPAPGVVVLQEIFGVNHHIQSVTRRFAEAGYVALAPELFHRTVRGYQIGYEDFTAARPHTSKLSNEGLTTDIRAAIAHVRGLPRVGNLKVGVVGFCMGGFASFLAACRTDVDAAVCFYGAGIVNPRPTSPLQPMLPEAAAIRCPVLCFFGGKDAGIPLSDAETIRERLTSLGKKNEVVVYSEAGHGFHCDERPDYHAPSAKAAWQKTLDLFSQALRG